MSTKTLEELWFDRDLGWLEFNRRVLAEAQDERTPLLERLKFLGIFTSNLDEFFMKRIATLRLQSNGSHARLMEDLRRVIVPLIGQQRACLASLMPALEAHGVRILGCNDLTERQRLEASRFFEQNVSPALTPKSSMPPTPYRSFPICRCPGPVASANQAPTPISSGASRSPLVCDPGFRFGTKRRPAATGSSASPSLSANIWIASRPPCSSQPGSFSTRRHRRAATPGRKLRTAPGAVGQPAVGGD